MSSTYIYTYKTTNTVNGKIYVGVHSTSDLEDDYLGSGMLLLRAIRKYGCHVFTREVIKFHDSLEAAYIHEGEIVNDEFVDSDYTYNVKLGGHGGFDHINKSTHLREKQRAGQTLAWSSHPERIKIKSHRASFDYKKSQNTTRMMVKTPFGTFPSKNDAMRVLNIGDFQSLTRWLDGKIVTRQMLCAMKTELFTRSDIGKLTTDIGWGYVPI